MSDETGAVPLVAPHVPVPRAPLRVVRLGRPAAACVLPAPWWLPSPSPPPAAAEAVRGATGAGQRVLACAVVVMTTLQAPNSKRFDEHLREHLDGHHRDWHDAAAADAAFARAAADAFGLPLPPPPPPLPPPPLHTTAPDPISAPTPGSSIDLQSLETQLLLEPELGAPLRAALTALHAARAAERAFDTAAAAAAANAGAAERGEGAGAVPAALARAPWYRGPSKRRPHGHPRPDGCPHLHGHGSNDSRSNSSAVPLAVLLPAAVADAVATALTAVGIAPSAATDHDGFHGAQRGAGRPGATARSPLSLSGAQAACWAAALTSVAHRAAGHAAKLYAAGRRELVRTADVVVATCVGAGAAAGECFTGTPYAAPAAAAAAGAAGAGRSTAGTGAVCVEASEGFSLVVVDESSQAPEAALLVPLSLLAHTGGISSGSGSGGGSGGGIAGGGVCAVLVGDQCQLPPVDGAGAGECGVLCRAEASAFTRLITLSQTPTPTQPLAHTAQQTRVLTHAPAEPRAAVGSVMLTQQHRMHSALAVWPSRAFYSGRLTSPPGIDVARPLVPGFRWPAGPGAGTVADAPQQQQRQLPPFPVLVIDASAPFLPPPGVLARAAFSAVLSSSDSAGAARLVRPACLADGGSRCNSAEAAIAALCAAHALLCDWRRRAGSGDGRSGDGAGAGPPLTVGVVTPYTAQAGAVRRCLAALDAPVARACSEAAAGIGARAGAERAPVPSAAVEVKSVDGYQGHEKDLIVATLVRSGEGGIGFVRDARRMNVRLTHCLH
jgi:hypothetical protein